MNLAGLLLLAQTVREPIPQPVSTQIRTEIIEAATVCGNGLYPRPCHDPAVNNGCSEWDVEQAELDNDGNPCVRTVDNYVIADHGDAIVSADDLTPASCDSGTGYWLVTSTWRARQLQVLNPGLVCVDGERYGAIG